MKLAPLGVVSALLLSLVVVGCKKDDGNDDNADGTLGTTEAQLVDDDAEASDADDDLEAGVDEPLSGATEADPGTPADATTDDDLLDKVKKNAGAFFKPAGCIASTRDGNKLSHVFTDCTGPWGLVKFNGTITSTYVREPGKLTITHEATGFTANGATISGKRVVVYTRDGAVVTKTRTGDWSGTTAKGKTIDHQANFVTTWDASSKCITREGSAQTTLGGRSFERSITDFKRCGIGRGGCPDGGTIALSRTKSDETLTVTIEFLGGVRYRVTRPNGKQVTRLLLCNAKAS